MQVKFKDEKSAKEAMTLLDGKEMNGSKLQVTQVFQLNSFKSRSKFNFHKTKLGLIKESEDSDEPERVSSEDRSVLSKIEENKNDNENYEQIK